MVLLEAVVAIPLLTMTALMLVWALSVAATSLALADAARQAARDLARGVDAGTATSVAQDAVPGAHVTVDQTGDPVVVVAAETVTAPGPFLHGISIDLVQRVSVPREWQ